MSSADVQLIRWHLFEANLNHHSCRGLSPRLSHSSVSTGHRGSSCGSVPVTVATVQFGQLSPRSSMKHAPVGSAPYGSISEARQELTSATTPFDCASSSTLECANATDVRKSLGAVPSQQVLPHCTALSVHSYFHGVMCCWSCADGSKFDWVVSDIAQHCAGTVGAYMRAATHEDMRLMCRWRVFVRLQGSIRTRTPFLRVVMALPKEPLGYKQCLPNLPCSAPSSRCLLAGALGLLNINTATPCAGELTLPRRLHRTCLQLLHSPLSLGAVSERSHQRA